MRPRLLLATLPLIFLATSTLAQEKLALLPEKPKVGEPFQVVLQPVPTEQPAEGQYTWEVAVRDQEQKDITAEAAPGPYPNAAALMLPAVRPNVRYDFKLKIATPAPRELSLEAESGNKVMIVTKIQPSAAAAPMPEAQPMAAATAPAAVPENIELKKMGERLEAAKRWAKQVSDLPKSQSLVLPVEFFQEHLAKRPDGKEGILEFAHRPILDATELHRAMMEAANQFPAETDPDRFIEAWHDKKKDFLAALPERNAATPLIVELWKEFTDVWEQEVLKQNKARFREALIQAPLIIAGVLLEFDARHIEAAMTGGPAVRSGTAASGGPSIFYGGGYSHAAVHHARAMSRIYGRHYRSMARLGY